MKLSIPEPKLNSEGQCGVGVGLQGRGADGGKERKLDGKVSRGKGAEQQAEYMD